MNTIETIADLLEQIINSDNLEVIHATAKRAQELADSEIKKGDKLVEYYV